MRVLVNEKGLEVAEGSTVEAVGRLVKPDADVVIHNGFPALPGAVLEAGDTVVLIRRGERPDARELEALLLARHTPGVHRRLKAGRVGIAGLGGLGSAVAVALARSGVGALVLADFDVVEPSNLNRQQYFLDQVGTPKAEALRDILSRINPCVAVTARSVVLTPENIPEVFEGVHVLVEAFDAAPAKAMLVDTAMVKMRGVAVVSASGLAGTGPSNLIVTSRPARNLFVVGDGVSEARPRVGLMAPRVAVAAGHQANAVIRLLLGEDPVAAGPAGACNRGGARE